MYVHICTYVCTYVQMYVHIHMCICTYVLPYTYAHTYICTYVQMHIHIRMYVHMHRYTSIYICTYVHMYRCTSIYICTSIYLCTYVQMHVHICTYVHMYRYMCIWTYCREEYLRTYASTMYIHTKGFIQTLHSVPISCTLCQPVLIVSTSDKKYRFGVPFKVLTKQVRLYLTGATSFSRYLMYTMSTSIDRKYL